jgi:subtilisin family serine protease
MLRSLILVTAAGLGLAACSDISGPRTAAPAPEGGGPEPLLATASAGSGAEVIPGQYIVVFNESVTDAVGKAKNKAAKHKGKLKHAYKAAIKGFAAELSDAAVAALRADPDVAYVEQDQVMRVVTDQTPATWGIDRIDQRALPLNSTYTYTPTGAGVTVYIIDTGIRVGHQEFGGRATSGYDAVDGALPADDCNGHGTHVAGTVGGSTYGVAKGVSLVAVRVLSCAGSGTTSGVIAGIDWVTANHQAGAAAAANMSLGGGASTALDAAVQRSISDGVTYAIAAGNSSANACNASPARVAEAITIGATTSSDARASYSNYGSCLDLFAPGSSITSAWYTSNTATNTISGTSMAAPHAAGVAALYLQGNTSASPQTVRDAIFNSATSNVVTNAGTGSPNKLLFAPLTTDGGGSPPPPPPPPSGAPCTSCTAYSGSLSGAGDADIHPNGTYYQSSTAGTHSGWLRGPAGTDFDLYLEKWNGWWWSTVARSESTDSEEDIAYSGGSGYYRWRVRSYAGSGSYTFWLQKP